MKKFKITTVFVTSVMCVACVSKPVILKYYDSSGNNFAEIDLITSVFVTSTPPSPRPLITTLSDRGQEEYISAQAARTKTTSELRDAVAQPIIAASSNQADDVSALTYRRRIVFSADQKGFKPADRLTELSYNISFNEASPFSFVSWDRFTNLTQTLDFGTIEYSTTTSVGANLGLSPSLTEVGIEASSARTIREEINLNRAQVRLSGQLDSKNAKIFQRGFSSVDINGSLIADLTMRTSTAETDSDYANLYSANNLSEAGGTINPAEKVSWSIRGTYFPKSTCEVKANFNINGTLRYVTSGDDTFIEGDDRFELISLPYSQTESTVTLIDKESLIFTAYAIQTFLPDDNTNTDNDEYIQIAKILNAKRNADGSIEKLTTEKNQDRDYLQFRSRQSALQFAEWLNAQATLPDKVGGRSLTYHPTGTKDVSFAVVQVELNDRC